MMETWTEQKALYHLFNNFNVRDDGMIRAKPGYVVTETDMSAITYLFEEFDYGFMPTAGS